VPSIGDCECAWKQSVNHVFPLTLTLELPVVHAVADISVHSGRVDLVAVDLATSELRNEHRRVHGALLSGEIAEP